MNTSYGPIRSIHSASLSSAILALAALSAAGSSHREAPDITRTPKLDCTDFYMFRSYETNREDYVTLIADYLPLQDAYGGPNFFQLDDQAVYEIHVDNNGDAVEDLTFQFRFHNQPRDIALTIGPEGNQRTNAVPVLAVGPITVDNQAALNVDQTYRLSVIAGPRRTGSATPILNPKDGTPDFTKPQDNVGTKTFPDYDAYANADIYEVSLPNTDKKGRVFVGQRKDPFVVNLGETFDLINISTGPTGPEDINTDSLADKNVTALCLELPMEYLLGASTNGILGAWSTASRMTTSTEGSEVLTQVSRLAMPLVNEVVIGLKDKDKFNASEPKDDLQFADYITHPTLPAIIELLYPNAKAPTQFPREDLLAVFATGVDGLNKNGSLGEMQRLNTAVPPVARELQKNMGVLAGDNAGFPNGRRPGDDVVDMALRVVMGALLPADVAPAHDVPFTDGATVNAGMFPDKFPYLNSPIAGSPNEPTITITPQVATQVKGPYTSVAGTFDATTRTLTVAKPNETVPTSFLRLKSDRPLRLSQPQAAGNLLRATVP